MVGSLNLHLSTFPRDVVVDLLSWISFPADDDKVRANSYFILAGLLKKRENVALVGPQLVRTMLQDANLQGNQEDLSQWLFCLNELAPSLSKEDVQLAAQSLLNLVKNGQAKRNVLDASCSLLKAFASRTDSSGTEELIQKYC